jgi:hypothetical protein
MPELGNPTERRAHVVLTEDGAVFVKIGDVEDFVALYACTACNAKAWRSKWSKKVREGDLLLILQNLAGSTQTAYSSIARSITRFMGSSIGLVRSTPVILAPKCG